MEDSRFDDYPLLDFTLDDEGAGSIYAEDQVIMEPDGPEIAPIELPWDNGEDDDVEDDGDEFNSPYPKPDDEDDGFVPLTSKQLSCCHEEWEDWI